MHTSKTIIYTSEPDSLKESLNKVWKNRSLIWLFAKRDLRVKYTQTYLGLGWSIFKPLFSLSIFVFFGHLLNWSSNDLPYAVYVLTGLIGWNLFTYIIINGLSATYESGELIKKIYFPKSILLFSKTLVGLFEALISILLLIVLLVYYDIQISSKVFFLPLILLFNVSCGFAVTFIVASVSITKRDLLHVLPYLLHMAIWLTPVFLSVNQFPAEFQFVLEYNPIANVIDSWRWALLDGMEFKLVWAVSFFTSLIVMLLGFYLYTHRENKIADRI